MINLLPPQQKKEIEQRRYRNIIFHLEILFLLFLISFIFVIFTVKNLIESEVNILKIKAEAKEKEMVLYEPLEKKVKDFNALISDIYSFYQNQQNFTEIIKEISETIPTGTYLKRLNFSISEDKKEPILALLSGFAQNRNLLLLFRQKLQEKENFFDIYFPIEGWLAQENINFSAQFKIKLK